MSELISLTIEQQFTIELLKARVQEMSREQLQFALVELYRQMMLSENSYKQVLKNQWGINSAKPNISE